MAHTPSYTPVFRGQFPADARARWADIDRFLGQWCGVRGTTPSDTPAGGDLVKAARVRCAGSLSFAIEQWLTLAERAGETGTPAVRDYLAVGPIEDHLEGGEVTGATVILVAGEQDMFWAVSNARLGEDDPPVEVYQAHDPSHPPLVGRNGSVSEFALKYLCLYNEHAEACAEWFSADGTEVEVRAARGWFDHALVLDSDDGWCGPLWLLESEGVAAVGRGGRLEVSAFVDPVTLGLPPFLQGAMERHRKLRQQFRSAIHGAGSVADGE